MANAAPRNVELALIQMACGEDPDANLRNTLTRIEEAAAGGAKIVCLQELFRGRYPCQEEDHAKFAQAEPLPGPTSEAMRRCAADLEIVIVASLFERRAHGLYHNTAIVVDADGELAGVYRKMHIPDDPLYYEKFYFTPGDLGFVCADTRYARIGVLVCWDQWFPEAARLTALRGAELLVYPTAIGWLPEERATYGPSQHAAWETMMRSHAIANGVFVAAANRVGVEDSLHFWGASFVSDPYGVILARASHDAEELLHCGCDLSLIDTARTHWPFLRDRRIDAYQDLTRRYVDDAPTFNKPRAFRDK